MKSLHCSLASFSLAILFAVGCAPSPGPDKQFSGGLAGAATGAGAGAVTGFQLGAGAGPGAAVGAGFGAVAGGIKGYFQDQNEENLLRLSAETRNEREIAMVHEILNDHYRRRMELHPARDIYPADLFFRGDEVKLRPSACRLVKEIARLNKDRMPWSRLAIATYSRANTDDSFFARHLAEGRSKELVEYFVKSGIEARRLETRSIVIDAPLLIDPADDPSRYNQAVEIIPLDR